MTQCIKKSVIEPSMGYSRQNQTGLYEIFRGTEEEMACAISKGKRISRGGQEKMSNF